MLQSFIACNQTEEEKEQSRNFFKHTEIAELMNESEMHQYPVVLLELGSINPFDFEDFLAQMRGIMSQLYLKFSFVKSKLEEFQNCLRKKADPVTSLVFLCESVQKFYGKRVILLVDEYETPIFNSYGKQDAQFCTRIVNFMSSFLTSCAKSSNTPIFKMVLFGIMKISNQGFLSGLNNLQVLSMQTDLDNKDIFGIPNLKLEKALDIHDKETLLDIKQWYNGYDVVSSKAYLCNIYSILSYLSNKQKLSGKTSKFKISKSYWSKTGGSALVSFLLSKCDEESIYQQLDLVNEGSSWYCDEGTDNHEESTDITSSVEEFTGFNTESTDYSNLLWTSLYYCGYITGTPLKKRIPNNEVRLALADMCLEKFGNSQSMDNTVLDEILNGETHTFLERFNLLLHSASYFDLSKNSPEKHYHLLLLGWLAGCSVFNGQTKIQSNRESGDGRFDISITGPTSTAIIEIKIAKSYASLDTKAKEGLDKIITKKYIVWFNRSMINDHTLKDQL